MISEIKFRTHIHRYIIYKLPRFKKSSDALVRRGAAFAYMDADNADDWTSSGVGIDQSESHAVYHTLQQIYDPGTESAVRLAKESQ